MEPTITSYADAFEWFLAELGLERPHVAGQLDGRRDRARAGRGAARSRSVTAFSPAGFWTAPERRFTQLSLLALAGTPAPLQPAARGRGAHPRRAASRCSRRRSATRRGCPPRRRSRRCATPGPRPCFGETLKAFDAYSFERPEQLRQTPVTIAWGRRDRLLPYRLQAPRARAAAAVGDARHARRRARAVLRRPGGVRGGDPQGAPRRPSEPARGQAATA